MILLAQRDRNEIFLKYRKIRGVISWRIFTYFYPPCSWNDFFGPRSFAKYFFPPNFSFFFWKIMAGKILFCKEGYSNFFLNFLFQLSHKRSKTYKRQNQLLNHPVSNCSVKIYFVLLVQIPHKNPHYQKIYNFQMP